MIVLGLNHGEINSSAAIAIDGRIVAGSPEERFNREKRSKVFPEAAVRFCLSRAGIDLKDCSAIAQGWNSGAYWNKFNPIWSGQRFRREDYFYTVPDNLFRIAGRPQVDWVQMSYPGGKFPPTYFVQHHRCHAANSFFLSPFEEAAILTCDWHGELECTTFNKGTDNSIELLQSQSMPNSLGMFYGTFTELLGYSPDSDEWKVMALSAFDVDCRKETEAIRSTINLGENGKLELDLSFYAGASPREPHNYTEKLVNILGGRTGMRNEEISDWHYRVARAMQIVAEEIVFHFLNHLWALTKLPNLVVGGGFFMNSVLNGKILGDTGFKNLFVPYAPADVGNSIGAALYIEHCINGGARANSVATSFIGPDFSKDETIAALRRRRIGYEEPENLCADLARRLDQGEIIALHNGPMEFGERALGNRSIIADPRPAEMKNRINSIIKYRESYRPFAPAVPLEKVTTYFDVDEGFTCPFMEKVVPVRPAFRDQLQAITHVDGSGRVQTVEKNQSPFFHDVITRFGELTGLHCLLNTSFNINGEPIVLSPDDALSTFYNSGLETLVLGGCVVTKR